MVALAALQTLVTWLVSLAAIQAMMALPVMEKLLTLLVILASTRALIN